MPTILLVEDDPDISASVAFSLIHQGYQVNAVTDGEKAVEEIFQVLPDLVILDLMLPGMSGEEVCKMIRENHNNKIKKIPIIMLTAKSSEADAIVGRVIGANVYMAKPFAIDGLIQEIKKLI